MTRITLYAYEFLNGHREFLAADADRTVERSAVCATRWVWEAVHASPPPAIRPVFN